MYPCVIPGCAAMAEKDGGECGPHRAGYRSHDGSRDIRCGNCLHLVLKGQWYRRVGNELQHVQACKTHREVIEKRAKAKDAAAAR